jgi:hypothetical protein
MSASHCGLLRALIPVAAVPFVAKGSLAGSAEQTWS